MTPVKNYFQIIFGLGIGMKDTRKAAVTVRENIERMLAHLGLSEAVRITAVADDRVYGWPIGTALREYVAAHGWSRDLKVSAEHFHGLHSESFREPDGLHPALQVVFHPSPSGEFVEMDLDESAPVDVVSGVWHAYEVATNALLHRKTDQSRIAELIDKRLARLT